MGILIVEFEVYESTALNKDLTDVHFIKLKDGILLSENFYWSGNRRKDFTALNQLPQVSLKVSSKITHADGKYKMKVQIINPVSGAVAFGIRVQAVKSSTGEQILPAIMSANYFSLLKEETKEVEIEFNENALGNDTPKLFVIPYNEPTK